jgi:hypothetical protein
VQQGAAKGPKRHREALSVLDVGDLPACVPLGEYRLA